MHLTAHLVEQVPDLAQALEHARHRQTRDRHLRSEDFFHVSKFPAITFESLRVEGAGVPSTKGTL